MVSTKFVVFMIVLSHVAGFWFAMHYTRPLRKKAKAAAQEAAKAKADEERRGRERNARELLRRDVLAILDEAVECPERLHRVHIQHGGSPAHYDNLRRFLQSHQEIRKAAETVVHYDASAVRIGAELRSIRATQQDIQKALGMGQPINM